MKITVLSYNIHKGFTFTNRKFILDKIRASIRSVGADILLLQEVVGENASHAKKLKDWPVASQFEFLAEELWPHFAYGKNAVYTKGHHGNAILSKFPITSFKNIDISQGAFEKRGLLHAKLQIFGEENLHVICTHFGLKQKYRDFQTKELCHYIENHIPNHSPLIIGGDFNDWRLKITPIVWKKQQLMEAYLGTHHTHAKTFPSWKPALKLDRIYYRSADCLSVELVKDKTWTVLSDHLPLVATFEIP